MCLLQPLACNHIQVTPVRRTDAVYLPCTLKKKKKEIIDLCHARPFCLRRFLVWISAKPIFTVEKSGK